MAASGALLASLLGSCTGDGADGELGPDQRVRQPDQISGSIFNEKHIYAALEGTDLKLDVELGESKLDTTSGVLNLELRGLDGELISQDTRAFVYADGGINLAVTLGNLPEETTAADLVKYVIDYDVEWNGGEAKGTRSAYDALRKLEVILLTEDRLEVLAGGHFTLFALDPATAKPIAGAEVEVLLETLEGKTIEVASLETDENGRASGEIEVPTEDQGAHEGTLTVVVKGNGAIEESEVMVQIVRDQKVLLTTDKPMYQPGQTIHARALALHAGDKAPEANQELIFEIEDSKGNTLARELRTTDEYGIASVTIKLAHELNMGQWTLRAVLGTTISEKTITVDRYVLPKFKTTATLDRTWYAPGDTVTLQGEARYFFGQPVAGGTVHIVASTFDIDFSAFADVTAQTNEEGLFSVELTMPSYVVGTALEQGKGLLKIDITVTDTADQEQTISKTAPVAEGGVDVILVPESGELAAGIQNEIFVVTNDPLGTPLAAEVTISYDDELLTTVTTGASGLGSFTFVPGTEPTTLQLKAVAGDESVEVERTLAVGQDSATVLLRTDKSVYKVGDTVTLEVRVGEATQRVFVDMVHGGRTIDLRTVEIEKGAAGHAFDIDPSMEGDVLVSAFYVTDSGTIVRDQKLIFVESANELTVTMAAQKSTYLPGEDATIDVHVSDKDGKGVAAAVGMQIVDEAVFALQEVQPGLLKVFFALARELAEPRVTLKSPGYDAGQVIQGAPEGEDDSHFQERAKVAFAALGDLPAHSVQRDTYTDMVKGMTAVLKPFLDAERASMIEHLSALANTGVLTWENIDSYLPSELAGELDLWSRPYAVEVEPQQQRVTVFSNGPDERKGTLDDVTFQMTYYEIIYGQQMWAEEGDFANGGPAAGGADMDNDGVAPGVPADPNAKSGGNDTVKVRSYFPETLYVNPAVITEPNGTATIDVQMADSITEWRMTGLASSASGLLGSGTGGVIVFQDFFVDIDFPVAITRNDKFSVPVALYNYLEVPQAVTLEVEPADWIQVEGPVTKTVTLAPNEVVGVSFDIRALSVGVHGLTIFAYGTTMSDAVQRTVDVRPDGKAFEVTESGRFATSDDGSPVADTIVSSFVVPGDNIDNSQKLIVKVYPGFLSQAVEGMDSMLRLPGG